MCKRQVVQSFEASATLGPRRAHARVWAPLLMGLTLGSPARSVAFGGEGLSRADVLTQVLENHPAIEASNLRARAAADVVLAQGAYAPLMLDLDVAPGMFAMSKPGIEFSAAWALPLWGERKLAREAGRSLQTGAEAVEVQTRAQLAAETSIALDDVLLARAWERVIEHQRGVLETITQTVSSQVANGLADPSALTEAKLAALDLEEQALEASHALLRATHALQTLTGIDADALSPEVTWLEPAQTPTTPGETPTLQIARAQVALGQVQVELAKRENRPRISPMVSLNTMWPAPTDWAMLGVGFDVPVDARANRAQRDAAVAAQQAATSELAASERETDRRYSDAVITLQQAQSVAALLQEQAWPLARERVDLARNAWEHDRTDITRWLRAERDLIELEWRIAIARSEVSKGVATLAQIAGDLTSLLGASP